jgi:hypothetical protein
MKLILEAILLLGVTHNASAVISYSEAYLLQRQLLTSGKFLTCMRTIWRDEPII